MMNWVHTVYAAVLQTLSLAPASSPAEPAPVAASAPAVVAPVASATPALTTPTDPAVMAIVNAIQKTYDGTTDFSANFVQKYTYTMLRRTQESKGTLAFKKPGLMRWEYASPQKKTFAVDGKSLWVYQPEDNNAFVNACFQQSSDLVAPIAFMWGAGKIAEQFNVSFFEGQFGEKSDHHLLLLPKIKSAAFERLILVVDPKSLRVKQSVVVDASGNVNQFLFQNAKFNQNTADTAFAFVPPAGAHLARMPGTCDAPVPGLK